MVDGWLNGISWESIVGHYDSLWTLEFRAARQAAVSRRIRFGCGTPRWGECAKGVGDLLTPGFNSNYGERKLSWIYFSGALDAAIWGCELARGDGRERIYIVEPTGAFLDDPNLTDKKFPGNPARA